MIRFAFAFILITSALNAVAAPKNIKIQVINVEIGVHDFADQPTLCLTTAREVKSGRLIGLVEDITDCYWARQAKHSPEKILVLPSKDFAPLDESQMLQHLQGFDSQLEFLWSTAE